MTSYVENECPKEFPFDIKQVLDTVVDAVLEYENCPYDTQINLLLTDNEGIRQYNREYRKIDDPTDVLSFPMIPFTVQSDFSIVENNESDYFDPDTGELILGDIIISFERMEEQALKYGHSIKREFAFLVAHSMLHLCGYDHMEKDEALVMERKQEEILNSIGITRESL